MSTRALTVFWALILLAIASALMVLFTGHAHAATAKACASPAEFAAKIVASGGTVTAVPDANYAKARKLMEMTSRKPKPSDAAWFMEMGDGSSAVAFALKGCLNTMLLTPHSVPAAMMRGALLGERLSAPSLVAPLRGQIGI